MKKLLAAAAAILALSIGPVYAADSNYVMYCEKLPEDLAWGDAYEMVAVDKASGKVIPLSDCATTGYGCAYVPQGTEVSFEKRPEAVFNDVSQYGPAGLDRLSRRGVFVGDENGNFNEAAILTRAEMAALLARIIGADGEKPGPMPYADVPQDSWFASPVYALYARGIVAGDALFDPDRPVTREELVTMEYRLIKALGGKLEGNAGESADYKDADAVSDYARIAYAAMSAAGYTFPFDYADSEPYFDEYGRFYETLDAPLLLRPQSPVTRGQAAQYLAYGLINDFILNNAPAIPRDTAAAFGLDTEMPRITGSTSSYPITEWLYRGLFENNYRNHPMFPKRHDKTIESYKLLIEGKTDVILVPDPNSEVTALAEEKGVELDYTPIATEGLVFFTAADNPAENLTSADIERIYVDNAVTNWSQIGGPDAGFAAFCRNSDSGSHAQMEQFFLKGRDINENIRREHLSLAMSSILTEAESYNTHNPGSYALGYSMYYYFENAKTILGTDDSLKLLSVDGVKPTAESLADGSYPLATNYFAVIRKDAPADSPARKLVAFLTSPIGQGCVSNAGFGCMPGLTVEPPEIVNPDGAASAADFMFCGARWGATWEEIQQETGMEGSYVRQDDPSRVMVENAEYLGFPVKAALLFDTNPESATYGLNTVTVQFQEEDKQALLAVMEAVYGELQDTFLANNGYPSGKKDGWAAGETLESVLTPEEAQRAREQFRQAGADVYQGEDPEQAELMLKSYVDMRMRSPLKLLYFQDSENCLQFSGATAVYAQRLQDGKEN